MNKERGSAIAILLIAVALFAGLAYVFMQGSRGNTGMMTDETAKTYAIQIIAYGNDLKQTVKRMTLRGVKDTDLGFDNTLFMRKNNDYLNGPGHNSNCTVSSCRVFENGGQMQPLMVPPAATDPTTYALSSTATTQAIGSWAFFITAMDGVGTSKEDLVTVSHFIAKSVCLKINKLLGISDTPPILGTGANTALYNGVFPEAGYTWDSGPDATGKTSYCGQSIIGTSTMYSYYQVLLAR